MKTIIGNRLVNFLFNPALRPIEQESLSFAILNTIYRQEQRLKRSGECLMTRKIILESIEKNIGLRLDVSEKYFESLLQKLKRELYIAEYEETSKKEPCYRCTESGISHCLEAKNENRRIVKKCHEWFRSRVEKHMGEELPRHIWGEISKKFEEHVNSISLFQAKEIARLHFDDALEIEKSAGEELRTLKRKNEKINKAFERAIQDLRFNRPDMVDRWIFIKRYSFLIAKVFPFDKEIREFLLEDLKGKRICLDSNVIISLIVNRDKFHSRATEIFQILLNNDINFFWHELTEEEIDRVLKASEEIVEYLRILGEKDRDRILKSRMPSLVRTYFRDEWANWESLENDFNERFKQLRGHKQRITMQKLQPAEFSPDKDILKDFAKKTRKLGKGKAHDAALLLWIYCLRRKYEGGKEKRKRELALLPDHWLITFDRILHRFERENMAIDEPLSLSFDTLIFLLDPYVLAKASEGFFGLGENFGMEASTQKVMNGAKKPVEEAMEETIKRGPSYLNYNTCQRKIWQIIVESNLESFSQEG